VYIPSGSKESGDTVVFQVSSIYQYIYPSKYNVTCNVYVI